VEVFEVWPAALLVASIVLGLIVGSFLNVVAYRLPIMMERAWREQCAETDLAAPLPHAEAAAFNLAWPNSACPHCGQPIAAWQNIPVLSYLMLRGRCANCAEPISVRYPIVEAFVALASVAVAATFGASWQTLAALVFTWFLIALSLIDFDHKLLPDNLTLPLMWLGLLLSLIPLGDGPLFADLRSSVIGAAAGYMSLWTVYQLFKLATGKEGMGYGDFKLLAAIGAWLGWQALPLVILLSAAVGAVVGVGLIALGGRSRHAAIPFGPYLAGAAWIAMLAGPEIMRWYFEIAL
jgi:leader peptidase (prepilin peptidase)/N-methyltransferase